MNTVYVHGGVAGRRKEPSSPAHSLAGALRADGALDAVEFAITALEDDPALNAGYGSVLDFDGNLELDAGLAHEGRSGGVANVTVRHPITLARRVLEDTPHVLVTGSGAEQLGSDLERLDATSSEQHARWQRMHAEGQLDPARYGSPDFVDTVGAVALDPSGRLAAGSSTGGVFGKLPGRVGDAPVFGAGVYATHGVAVVGTGVGELFLELLASYRAGALVEEAGLHPQQACERVIGLAGRRRPAAAVGLLALDAEGRMGAAFRGGAWAVAGPDGAVDAVRLD
jgi:beta-aspartyl-peptidase (threonine type)